MRREGSYWISLWEEEKKRKEKKRKERKERKKMKRKEEEEKDKRKEIGPASCSVRNRTCLE